MLIGLQGRKCIMITDPDERDAGDDVTLGNTRTMSETSGVQGLVAEIAMCCGMRRDRETENPKNEMPKP
jgi:hypothetical protein